MVSSVTFFTRIKSVICTGENKVRVTACLVNASSSLNPGSSFYVKPAAIEEFNLDDVYHWELLNPSGADAVFEIEHTEEKPMLGPALYDFMGITYAGEDVPGKSLPYNIVRCFVNGSVEPGLKRRELIIDALKTLLEGITTLNGFDIDIKRVERYKGNIPQWADFPSIIIDIFPEESTDDVYPARWNKMTVTLIVWDESGDEEELDKKLGLDADIITEELMKPAGQALGGMSQSTIVISRDNTVAEGGRLGIVEMKVEILYACRYDDAGSI